MVTRKYCIVARVLLRCFEWFVVNLPCCCYGGFAMVFWMVAVALFFGY